MVKWLKNILSIFGSTKFKPIERFISESGLVQLDFPSGWEYRKGKYTYEFAYPEKLQGALIISILSNPNKVISINEEFQELKARQPEVRKNKIGTYDILEYAIGYDTANIIDFHFHFYYKRHFVYITYTTTDMKEDKLNLEYQLVEEVLQTIYIRDLY